jgi:hypothetical protein
MTGEKVYYIQNVERVNQLNVSEFENGTYLIEVSINGIKEVKKFEIIE